MERVVTECTIYKIAAPGFDGDAYTMRYLGETYMCVSKSGSLLGTKFSDGHLNRDLPLIFYWDRSSTERKWQMLDYLLGLLMGCGCPEEMRVPIGERVLARQLVQSVTKAFSMHETSIIDQVKTQVGIIVFL